jgi:hypothetical protein
MILLDKHHQQAGQNLLFSSVLQTKTRGLQPGFCAALLTLPSGMNRLIHAGDESALASSRLRDPLEPRLGLASRALEL